MNEKHQKVGRNDPCPCGSGLKYKKCCLPIYREKKEDWEKKEAEETIESSLDTKDLSEAQQEEQEQYLQQEKEQEQEVEEAVEPQMEYEDISDGDAVELYAKEFAECGYNIRLHELRTFFQRCLQKDGLVDSQRVKELCHHQRKNGKVVITTEDIDNFFDEL